MKFNKYLILLVCSFICCTTNTAPNTSSIFQVEAGEIDRQNSIISVSAPSASEGDRLYLHSSDGQIIPAQKSGQKITFILPNLKAGERINLEFGETIDNSEENMGVHFLNDAVKLTHINNEPVLEYRTGPGGLNLHDVEEIYYRGGYLHPLFTPKGHIITEQYTQQRPHQNGIWTGWYKTEWNGIEPNFWIQDEGTGEVKVHSIDEIRNGPVYAELQATHHFIEKITGNLTPVLSDKWTVRTYAIPRSENWSIHIFDLEVEQSNITKHSITLLEYIYGGVGFRGSDQWIGEENMQLITSEGEIREEAHMSRARWVLLSGNIDDEMASIAILSHPDNLRFPQPMFVNQQEPFFIFAPLQLGDFTLNKAESFIAKYRYIVIDGEIPSEESIERLWQDYANPPRVSEIEQ